MANFILAIGLIMLMCAGMVLVFFPLVFGDWWNDDPATRKVDRGPSEEGATRKTVEKGGLW